MVNSCGNIPARQLCSICILVASLKAPRSTQLPAGGWQSLRGWLLPANTLGASLLSPKDSALLWAAGAEQGSHSPGGKQWEDRERSQEGFSSRRATEHCTERKKMMRWREGKNPTSFFLAKYCVLSPFPPIPFLGLLGKNRPLPPSHNLHVQGEHTSGSPQHFWSSSCAFQAWPQ